MSTSTMVCWGPAIAEDPMYSDYHDTEWGRPLTGEAAMFERICLEGFQVGLSWATILHKRDAFREDFLDFDPEKVARFTQADIERLCLDPRIIRNRAKITATITGARIVVDMNDHGESLSDLVWSFAPTTHERPLPGGSPTQSAESAALAKELRGRGFRFVGPINTYATMQACGLVNDHTLGCPVGDDIEEEGTPI